METKLLIVLGNHEFINYRDVDATVGYDVYKKMINEGNEPISIIRTLTYHFQKLLTVLSYIENGETILVD